MAGNSTRAIFYALAANLGIAIAKTIATIITKSSSMLAETIHSFADCGNQLLLLLGMKRSQLPADESHPLGYGKVVYFWSFIVAVMLFSLGGLFSIYEGISKLRHPEPVHQAGVAIAILGLAIILELSSLLGALKEIRHVRGKKRFLEWLRHTRSSEFVVVLGEDFAAVIGLLLAMVFVLLSAVLHNAFYDALGSIFIGAVLLVVSGFLLVRMKKLLIGKSSEPEVREMIEREMRSFQGVEKVFNVITLQIGPYIMLAGKVRIKKGMRIGQACRVINRLEKKLKEKIPEIKWSFIEPDTED